MGAAPRSCLENYVWLLLCFVQVELGVPKQGVARVEQYLGYSLELLMGCARVYPL